MLSESKEIERIYVKDNCVFITELTTISRDGLPIANSSNPRQIEPGQDYSKEPAEVQAICKAVHTKAVVDAYKKATNEATP